MRRAKRRRPGRILLPVTAAFLLFAGSGAAFGESSSARIHGSIGLFAEGRLANRSTNVRQDWNAIGDIDLHSDPKPGAWSFAFSGRVTGDMDGTRASLEPGIYNGILETFEHEVQPWLYRAAIQRDFERGDETEARLTTLRLGRQYHTGGDFLWFDGAELQGAKRFKDVNVTASLFGGVPVRFYESATDDWLVGGGLTARFARAVVGLEGYHVEEDARYGWHRKDNVGRASVLADLSESLRFEGVVRAIDDDEMDGRARLAWQGPRGVLARLDYRFQAEDRKPHTTELDAASIVLGRSVGAFRRGFSEIGGDILIPLNERITLDVGATSRDFKDSSDRVNLDFDRYFATLTLARLDVAGRKADISVTGEAYETRSDWTRSVSGDISLDLSRTVRVSAGTSYAIYSYDYNTNAVKNDVRVGTAKLRWNATEQLRFEGRYDIEDDDYRVHHFVRAGFRYAF